jgi:tRNA(Arg) A34 adenosine deaminase TadA
MRAWAANLALRQARKSNYEPHQHGCVIVSGGTPLAVGWNSLRPATPQLPCSVHAEVAALKQGDFRGCDLYVGRLTRGKVALSRPCERCMIAIRKSGIRRVFFSVSEMQWDMLKVME